MWLWLQAWIATIADKLEVTLEGYAVPGTGFNAASKSSSSGGVKTKKRS
jgi:hypothetical protein